MQSLLNSQSSCKNSTSVSLGFWRLVARWWRAKNFVRGFDIQLTKCLNTWLAIWAIFDKFINVIWNVIDESVILISSILSIFLDSAFANVWSQCFHSFITDGEFGSKSRSCGFSKVYKVSTLIDLLGLSEKNCWNITITWLYFT